MFRNAISRIFLINATTASDSTVDYALFSIGKVDVLSVHNGLLTTYSDDREEDAFEQAKMKIKTWLSRCYLRQQSNSGIHRMSHYLSGEECLSARLDRWKQLTLPCNNLFCSRCGLKQYPWSVLAV
jgi:hypothetical protein